MIPAGKPQSAAPLPPGARSVYLHNKHIMFAKGGIERPGENNEKS
jgi:hypothetical protein